MKLNFRKFLFSIVVCCIIFTHFYSFCSNDIYSTKKIRVGFFQLDGYHIINADGNLAGYGYDYLQSMARYNNWEFEYIGYEKSWAEAQEMLENGEIDLLTSAQKTVQRMEKFDFSEFPMGSSYTMLTTRAGNSKFVLEDYSTYDGMRVGMLNENTRNKSFDDFAKKNNFSYEPVYFDSLPEMLEGLQKNNLIDSIVTSNLRVIKNEWVLAKFDPSPFYAIVKKGNTSLLSELNSSIEQLNIHEPNLQSELISKYYSPDNGEYIFLNNTERHYLKNLIENNQTLKILISPDNAPFSSFKNHVPEGIVLDILNEVLFKTNLPAEIVETTTLDEYEKMALDDTIDIKFDSTMTLNESENLGFKLSQSYLNVHLSEVRLKHNLNKHTIGLISGNSTINNYVSKKYTSKPVIYYDTLADCIQGLKKKEIDFIVLNNYVAEKVVYNDVTGRLTYSLIPETSVEISIAVKKHEDPALLSILNNAVSSIKDEYIHNLLLKYSSYELHTLSITRYFCDNPIICSSIVSILLLSISLFVFRIKKINMEKDHLNELNKLEILQKKDLKDALLLSQSSNKAKTIFLSRVSHEIRTPLNAVIGYLTLSKNTTDVNKIISYIKKAEISAKHLLAILNDVLDISSIESGKITITNTAFNLKELISSINSIFYSQCIEKGISFKIETLNITKEVLIGDKLRINQILMNILSNSLKFTPAGGEIIFKITQKNIYKNNVFLCFEIIDTGIGMNKSFKSRIFKPFEQENPNISQVYGGTGLGLSICKNLVDLMHGAINVESEKGKGSHFSIELPLEYDNSKILETDFNDSQSPSDLSDLVGKKILLVEDNPINMEIACGIFNILNIKTDKAQNGKEALNLFNSSSPGTYNAILMDIQMPEMDGYEATSLIRRSKHPEAKTIPIIAMTANAFSEDISKSLSFGMNAHVSKPIDVDYLVKILKKYIK